MPERRAFALAAAAGSLVAFVLDVLLLSGGHLDAFPDTGLTGGFYDAQGRAMLDGRLAVDPAAAGLEGFVSNGNTYLYFGPVLSLLRLPVLAVTHGLDGRLTLMSMVLGFAVLLAAAACLHWQVRLLARPDTPVGRPDRFAAFLMQVAVGAGAVPLFLAGSVVVYHETELWGAALAVAALAVMVKLVRGASLRWVALAGLLVALAVNTRVPAGLGGVLALLGLAALAATGLAFRDRPRTRTAAALAAAGLVALGSSAAVNMVKFHTPFGIPLDKQVFSTFDANRQAALADNGGSLFGLRYVPTTLLQAVRPDAIGTTRSFPYVGFPREPPAVVGSPRFDTLERSLSAPTSMTLLVLLTLVGLVAAARAPALRPLLVLLAGSAAGGALSLTIAYVTTRYLADFVPLLLLGALIGTHALLPRVAALRRGPRLAWAAGATTLVLAGIVVNGSAGLVTQRLLAATTPEADRASFVLFQDRVDRALGRSPHGVGRGAALPAVGVPGDLFVLGDCDGLYVSGHREWIPVERTPRSGVHRLRVRLPAGGLRRAQRLATLGAGRGRATVVVGPGRSVAVRTARGVTGRGTLPPTGPAADVRLTFDELRRGRYFLSVRVDGREVVTAPVPYDRLARLRLSGRARPAATAPPAVCRRILQRLG